MTSGKNHDILTYITIIIAFSLITVSLINMKPLSRDLEITGVSVDATTLCIEVRNSLPDYTLVQPYIRTGLLQKLVMNNQFMEPEKTSKILCNIEDFPSRQKIKIYLEYNGLRTESLSKLIVRKDNNYIVKDVSIFSAYTTTLINIMMIFAFVIYIRSELHLNLKQSVRRNIYPDRITESTTSPNDDDKDNSIFDKIHNKEPSKPNPLYDMKDDIEKDISKNIKKSSAKDNEKIAELSKLLDDGIIDENFFKEKKNLIMNKSQNS